MLPRDCLDLPVILYLKKGNVLEASSLQNKRSFTTKFFLITQINHDNNCVTLMLLQPCNLCCVKNVLKPMNEFITIDMNCLCGYQIIQDICIKKCNHPPIQFKDKICTPFTLYPGKDELILWQSNIQPFQEGIINLHIEVGKEELLKLNIYSDTNQHEEYHLTDQTSYTFSIKNCYHIKLSAPKRHYKVSGTFKIIVRSVIEH